METFKLNKFTSDTKTNKSINYKEIFYTAIFTSILTLGSSYFIMKSQLSEEQKYWSQRLQTERSLNILDKKVAIFEEVNAGILESEVLAKEIKIGLSTFYAQMALCKLASDCKTDINELNKNIVKYHKHINFLSAKIQMIPLYFSSSVSKFVNPLIKALELNYPIIELSLQDMKESKEYFDQNFNTINELIEARLKLISEMLNDMSLHHKNIM